jgi:pimeloyl-ACP methyl ester carboxylesterase
VSTWLAAVVATMMLASCASRPRDAQCTPLPGGAMVAAGEARIAVRTVGAGAPVLMIPSLGRSVSDFDDLANRLAVEGRMSILAEPRNVGASSGPAPQTLADLADDAAAAVARVCEGPVDVVGHAFGQRVARQLAARHPDKVKSLVTLAAGGRTTMPDEVRRDLALSAAQGEAPDAERLSALQRVFFARGRDARSWLTGWFPQAARQQTAATQATNVATWWTAGEADMLVVQASEDPIAPPQNSEILRAEAGARVRVVTLPRASHAMLPEQPEAIAAVVAAFLGGERSEAALQAAIDRTVRD